MQRPDEGLGAHHPHDVRAALDHALIERRGWVERNDPALAQSLQQVLLGLLGQDRGQLEAELFLPGDAQDQAPYQIDLGIGAGRTARTDQQRHAQAACAPQHEPKVARNRLHRKGGAPRAQVLRPRIGGAGVAADDVRTLGQSRVKAFL